MTTNQNENQDVQSHCFDPFPQPQTIPAGWDLSTLLSTAEADTVREADDSSDTESN
jgi:hypothetical protein